MPTEGTRTQRLLLPALHRYFRVELHGEVERIPRWSEKPCIFVMNHTALIGLEVYLLYAALKRLRPDQPRVRTTVWPSFLKVPVLGNWYRAGGCLGMTVDAVTEALRTGDSVLILPEGPGATDVRNEVGAFHAGFLRVVQALAGELEVPVVPLGWSGIDEANPWFVTANPLLVKLFMKPVMPSFDFALLPRFPLLRPSKVVFVAGEPIRLGAADLASEDQLRAQVARVRNCVIDLVGRASDARTRCIEQSFAERVLHSALRMRDVRWSRRR